MKKFDNRQPELADLKAVMALMAHGTVTRAAQTLGTSQSALSYQLDRMRKRFGDALFVRIGNRMAATPFTQRLAEPAARCCALWKPKSAACRALIQLPPGASTA